MPSATEIREQVAGETDRRARLAVPAFAGGVVYLLSAIIVESTLKARPTVGIIEGLRSAFAGEANPPESPGTAEVKYISHHAFALIAGSTLAIVAIGALTLILLLLSDATRFRRPQTWSMGRPLVLFGGIGFAAVSLAHQIVAALETHKFAVGHDHSAHAVEQALTRSTANVVISIASLAGLALAVGMIAVVLNALRVGLLPRWMGILGIFTGLLIFLPITVSGLQVVQSFWMVMMGILLIGKWPNGQPPAWEDGEARPWPPGGRRGLGGGAPAAATVGGDIAPAPARPAVGSSRKRRKR